MPKLEYLVACPAWDRSWSLDLWFQSVRDNVDPAKTALAFVVPPEDEATRETIRQHTEQNDFAWVEVMRDKNAQFDRDERSSENKHHTLAVARNRLLGLACKTRPRRFLSWDSDLLLSPGAISRIEEHRKLHPAVIGVWAWLNRHEPHRALDDVDGEGNKRRVLWEEPMQATAMEWIAEQKAVHLPGADWDIRTSSLFRADVVLGFQMMPEEVYTSTHYAAHVDGEDIPFNWQLERRKIPRYIFGDEVAVHLYNHDPKEIALGWPGIMDLANCKPLAATRIEPRDPVDETLGFYPVTEIHT